MKKVLLLLMLIVCLFTFNINSALAEGELYVKVIYTSINAYNETNVETAEVVETFTYGNKLKLAQENVVTGQDGYAYYLVEISEGVTAYVFCSQVLSTKIESPKKDLDSNSSVKEDAVVYNLQNEEYIETSLVVKNGSRIKVLDGLDLSKEYTRIQFLDEEGQILTGHIKTATINQSGISRGTIGAIIIVIVTISLVLLVFGIKGKKKKKTI